MVTPHCPYCGKDAELVTGEAIYAHLPHLHHLQYWACETCDAYVGCHAKGARVGSITSDGTLPLGTLANAHLRSARSLAHRTFDPLWRSNKSQRRAAYAWLANELKIPTNKCHIAMMDASTCSKVVVLAQRRLHQHGCF